jgi:hypothetical protein
MPRLIVIRDVLGGGRAEHELTLGARMSDELQRLFPEGFRGPWYLYRDTVLPDQEIDWRLHETTLVENAKYILIVCPAGPSFVLSQFLWQVAISLALSAVVYLLTPKPRTPRSVQEERESPNNAIAGQTNLLRPGARVPDILGRVRAYPDLITNAIEQWDGQFQYIEQFFVLGMGSYVVEEARLGETSTFAIAGSSYRIIRPGEQMPDIRGIRVSPEINSMSLMAEDSGQQVSQNVTFTAGANTMQTQTALSAAVGDMMKILGTLDQANDGLFKIMTISGTGPYVYTLDRPVVTQTNVNPILAVYTYDQTWTNSLVTGSGTLPPGSYFYNGIDVRTHQPFALADDIQNGWLVELVPQSAVPVLRCFVSNFRWLTGVPGYTGELTFDAIDELGQKTAFSHTGQVSENMTVRCYRPGGASSGGGSTGPIKPAPSNWYRVPMDNPDSVWVDVGFPQGLVKYTSGVRGNIAVAVTVDFRRPGNSTIVGKEISASASTSGGLRYTHKYPIAELGLPAGTGIEVRLTRVTQIEQDTDTVQTISDTRWERLAAVKMVQMPNPSTTIIQLALTNDRSSVSMGATSFNCVATRVLPRWTGSGWDVSLPTERWADNLIARMKASDGANKTDAEIDLAGIYAIQVQLDAQDGGDQGKISMTLDQLQDIDSELQSIASVVRGQVYRIGRKLYVTRDQGGKAALALFTGRSKSPDGEQVQFALKSDSENDAVIVPWMDRANGWKQREYQYPPAVVPLNPLRIAPPCATWAQAWRRAQYEWNRIVYRRDTLNVNATEEARLLHIGDVVNVTDDVADLALSAGEVIGIKALTLELDLPVDLTAGGYTILVRAQNGRTVDSIPITAGATAHHVVLARAAAFELKGRDDSLGTIYAVYRSAAAVVRPWLVTNLEPGADYTRIIGTNWREEVFAGDAATLPSPPTLLRFPMEQPAEPAEPAEQAEQRDG